MKKIHVGFLLSYDYEKLKYSIPPVYEEADRIFIAMDEKNRTWSGEKFEVSNEFYDWLEAFDVQKKITFYRADFYVSELSAIQNDTRERHLLSIKMGVGNWLIQVDSDEIFIDFTKFVNELKKYNKYLINPEKTPIQISGFLVNIYKYLDNGILYVNQPTKVFLATNYPNYKVARKTKERIIYTDNVLLHECLSRSEDELRFKFKNWGHNKELNTEFFDKWLKADETNYQNIKNVFYLEPNKWKELGYFKSKSLEVVKELIFENTKLRPSKWFLLRKNFGQWFKFLDPLNIRKKRKFENYFHG
mgnify:CR=1 FL=1